MNPAICILAYRKEAPLRRLLHSLLRATYEGEVPLIFLLDGGYRKEVKKLVEEFEWPFGTKEIREQETIGLAKMNLLAGSLSDEFGAVIVLEDDAYCGEHFYSLSQKSLSKLSDEESLAGIALYRYPRNYLNNLPFQILKTAKANFFMRKACTLGTLYTQRMWIDFENWRLHHEPDKRKMPAAYKKWLSDDWELEFNAYLVDTKRFVSYPYNAAISNQGGVGTHHPNEIDSGYFQLNIPLEEPQEDIVPLSEGVLYDEYGEILPKCLKRLLDDQHPLKDFDFETDLHALKHPDKLNSDYVLTSRPCKSAIQTYAGRFKPPEYAVIAQVPGKGVSLALRTEINEKKGLMRKLRAQQYFSWAHDPGLKAYLFYKWLKYVERKKRR